MITNKAIRLYNLIINNPNDNISLAKRCCDFKKLEAVLEKWLSKELNEPATNKNLHNSEKNNPPQKGYFSVAKLKAEAQRVHNQSQSLPSKEHSKKKNDHSL